MPLFDELKSMVRQALGHDYDPDGHEKDGRPKDSNTDSDAMTLMSIVRLSVVFFLVIGVVFGGLFLYTQHWPPIVINETGSMTHDDAPYGRIGTVDAGDMFLVKKIDGRSEITTYLVGKEINYKTYDDYGDVIFYHPDGDDSATTIIHRVMAYVKVFDYGSYKTYLVDGYGTFGSQGINIPEWGLVGYKPQYSGFITAGDHNLATSGTVDQNSGISALVKEEWIVGKSVGEIPWFGLIKMWFEGTILGEHTSKINFDNAPGDCKTSLVVAIIVLFALPFGIDYIVAAFRKIQKNFY